MTPKITRTFRIPADLVERFDRAAEALGIDRTQVVVEAIQKFVEKYEAGQLFEHDCVFVDKVFVPEIGLCEVVSGNLVPEGKTKMNVGLKALNNERKITIDGKPASYTIERIGASIDFKNRICVVRFLKCWIGGLVEKETISFRFVWKEKYEDDGMDMSYVTIWPESTGPQS